MPPHHSHHRRYIDERYRVWGSCRGCGKHRLLDLEEVAARVGRDYSPPEHKGRIRVETAEGRGSNFRVFIPADLDSQLDPSATRDDKPTAAEIMGEL